MFFMEYIMEYLEFKLTSDTSENLNKLKASFHDELKEAFKGEVKIL